MSPAKAFAEELSCTWTHTWARHIAPPGLVAPRASSSSATSGERHDGDYRRTVGLLAVAGQLPLQRYTDLDVQRTPPHSRAEVRPICRRADDQFQLACADPAVSRDLKTVRVTEEGDVSVAGPEGDPHRLALVPPRPQWVARRGTTMRPLHAAGQKIVEQATGLTDAQLLPRYTRHSGTSGVEPWLEGENGAMTLIRKASFQKMPDRTTSRCLRPCPSYSACCRPPRRDAAIFDPPLRARVLRNSMPTAAPAWVVVQGSDSVIRPLGDRPLPWCATTSPALAVRDGFTWASLAPIPQVETHGRLLRASLSIWNGVLRRVCIALIC